MAIARTDTTLNRIFLVLGILLLAYAIYALNGYGNHDDIYRMLSTWRTLVTEQRYQPSRFQGYLVPEMIIGLASELGGFYLSNLVSVAMSITSLFIFYLLLIRVTTPWTATLATLVVGVNPFWVIPSTTSTDYIYPIFFLLLGLWLFLNERFRAAGLVFSLAISSRITYGPLVVLVFLVYWPYLRQNAQLKGRFFQGLILFFLGCLALYLPVFLTYGNLSFLSFADDAKGGWFGTVARFLYKNVYFWGLPAFIALLVFLGRHLGFYGRQLATNPFSRIRAEKTIFHAVFWCFLYTELWFARLPHQYQYLLPILFCVGYFIAILPNRPQRLTYLSLLIGLQLVYGLVVNFDVLETYQNDTVQKTIHSDGARLQPGLKPGIIWRDREWRSTYQAYQLNQFNERWQNYRGLLR